MTLGTINECSGIWHYCRCSKVISEAPILLLGAFEISVFYSQLKVVKVILTENIGIKLK